MLGTKLGTEAIFGMSLAIPATIMRISRKLYLPQSGGATVHKFWRAHNKEFLLQSPHIRDLYLKQVSYSLNHKSIQGKVKLHAYCVMSNHSHQVVSYQDESKFLSSYMRVAHSNFGQKFNHYNNRQGAVAYDRPQTPLVQTNDFHQMRLHFYIEANPLRANLVKNLKLYPHSSYRFYAFGIKDEFTKMLTIPQWYLHLGRTPSQRQKKYRELFDRYLKESNQKILMYISHKFIGEALWVHHMNNDLKKNRRSILRTRLIPPN